MHVTEVMERAKASGNLHGKSAIVTGSTSGIGLGIARALGKAGANVMFNGFGSSSEFDLLREELEKSYRIKTAFSGADMSKEDDIGRMIEDSRTAFGQIDILVNNAGIQHVEAIETFPVSKWNAIIAVDLSAAFHTIRAVVPEMKMRGWGRIINIASVAGMRAVGKGRTAYGTSKAAVIGLTRQIASELAVEGITANTIAPGPIDTPLTEVRHSPAFREAYTGAIPMKRYGRPAEIASLVSFLASESSAYITGVAIPVDGGFMSAGALGT